jgi:hypothetical protein
MTSDFSSAAELSAAVSLLIEEVTDRLIVSGHAIPKMGLGRAIGRVSYPHAANLKWKAQPVRWLLEPRRSNARGSEEERLWWAIGDHLGPIAHRLEEVKQTYERLPLPKSASFKRAFDVRVHCSGLIFREF